MRWNGQPLGANAKPEIKNKNQRQRWTKSKQIRVLLLLLLICRHLTNEKRDTIPRDSKPLLDLQVYALGVPGIKRTRARHFQSIWGVFVAEIDCSQNSESNKIKKTFATRLNWMFEALGPLHGIRQVVLVLEKSKKNDVRLA